MEGQYIAKKMESCLFLEKDPDALAEIARLLYQKKKGWKGHSMNSLDKKKMGKEMRMNVQINGYDMDSIILDLGSYVNILMKQT